MNNILYDNIKSIYSIINIRDYLNSILYIDINNTDVINNIFNIINNGKDDIMTLYNDMMEHSELINVMPANPSIVYSYIGGIINNYMMTTELVEYQKKFIDILEYILQERLYNDNDYMFIINDNHHIYLSCIMTPRYNLLINNAITLVDSREDILNNIKNQLWQGDYEHVYTLNMFHYNF